MHQIKNKIKISNLSLENKHFGRIFSYSCSKIKPHRGKIHPEDEFFEIFNAGKNLYIQERRNVKVKKSIR